MKQPGSSPTAVVIGAGAGGIGTAARLAKAGFKVTVVEKNDFTGGRCSIIDRDGFRFDQGPSLLLLPELFREAYNDLDTSLEAEGVELLRCKSNYNIWFGDGECVEQSSDLARMKTTIEKWEGEAGFHRYLAFLQEAHRHYEVSLEYVLNKNFMHWYSILRPGFLRHLITLHPFESIYRRASKYFLTERLRRAFTFGSMYMGMSPFDAPGTYSLLQYTELAEGIWYPKGGFQKVLDGLVRVGQRLGVEYRLSSPVDHIMTAEDNNKKVTGVKLADGSTLEADVVICNADLVYAYNNLLPRTSHAKSLSKREASCSSISFYWALDRKVPELQAHNIFLADEYRESFDSIFKEHMIPKAPSFYVNVPSRVDPTAAPDGKDAVVVLVPVGHLIGSDGSEHKGIGHAGDGGKSASLQNWDDMVGHARKTIISTLGERLGVDLSPLILHESINTPVSWKEAFNLDKGAILGLSHSFFNVLCFRPKTKHPNLKGLYFVGASTHPGTGVPICLAGSKIVSEQILSDRGMNAPWKGRHGLLQRKKGLRQKVSALDDEHGTPVGFETFTNRFVEIFHVAWYLICCMLVLYLLRSLHLW
jgi:phytoene desaturase (3,4-didehydrolycopene-forming)